MKTKATPTGSDDFTLGFKDAPVGGTPVSASEAKAIATNAYIFGYPLVLLDVTRQVSTAVATPTGTRAPLNRFAHLREFLDHTFTQVVSPNADTLYSTAFLDLDKQPMVLSVPDMGKRYYLMPLLDAWSDVFAAPGTRTTGNGQGDFAIVGPRFAAVHAIQDRYALTPLGAWGKPYTPPVASVDSTIDVETPPSEQVARMTAAAFFDRLNSLLESNPPSLDDAPALKLFAAVGIGPGREIDFDGGATTIRVQHDSPGEVDESNCLPAPRGPFNLIMRLYWPDQSIVDGRWKAPPVERAA